MAKRSARRFAFGRWRVRIPGPGCLTRGWVFFRDLLTPSHLDMNEQMSHIIDIANAGSVFARHPSSSLASYAESSRHRG
jgi:hypothetical protein